MGETESDASDLAGRFHYPVPYRIGVGCVAELAAGCRDLGIERPLVVTDPGLLALDWMSPLLESLDSAGLAACVFSEIDANPATHHVTSGVEAARRVLDFSFGLAPAPARAALGTDRVLAVRRLNLADGEPFARVTVWCPETLGSALSRDDVEARPFYELLADTAGVHLAGASQTIVAGAASADDAELLGVPTGSPVLICERTTRSADGSSVLFSEHVYPGHRMAFTVDLAPGASSDAPAGLRLVE